MVGSTVSPNCMTQLGHHASTCLVFDCVSLWMVLLAKRPSVSMSPARSWLGAAAMGRPAHHLIVGADHVHDVEAEQRDVRRLQHVAAGVEHHVRQFGARRFLRRLLAEADQRLFGQLQPRQHARRPRRSCGTTVTPCLRRSAGVLVVPHHREPRHRQQEARIDAVVAGLDALAAGHAGLGPFLGFRRALAEAQDVEHAGDHGLRDRRRRGPRAPRSGRPRSSCRIWCRRRACRRRGW